MGIDEHAGGDARATIEGVFPEPRTLPGKRLVPQLAVGCLLLAIVGVLGTYLLGSALQPYFRGDRDKLVKEVEAREAQGHRR